jgi:hypothetical protein
VYDEGWGGLVNAGAVQVVYGSPSGLDPTAGPGNQLWNQDSPDIRDQAESYDEFGRNLGAGDYNCDGYTDLAIGVRGEDLVRERATLKDAGAVNVIYGGPNGLQADAGPGNQFWTQDSDGVLDRAESHDSFGWTIVIGTASTDFNGDGCDDLVVSSLGEDVGAVTNAGAANAIYGSPGGLDANAGPGNQFWSQDSAGILDQAEPFDNCARSFSSADFNADGYDDLAWGCETEDLELDPTIVDAGAVNLIYGGPNGLQAPAGPGNQFWSENDLDASDGAEDGDWFGRTGLMAGDLNGDGYGDLAVGILLEDVGSVIDTGAAAVIYGGPNGLQTDAGPGNQFFSQDSEGILDQSEPKDTFARYLDIGDFNADGYDDLAVGVEAEDLEILHVSNAGATSVIYGSAHGLDPNAGPGNQFWTERELPSSDGSESNDRMGRMLAAGDFNGDGVADLAVGVPSEDINGQSSAGAVALLYGSPGVGLAVGEDQFFSQDTPDILDQSEAGDVFGRWLVGG